MENRTDQDNAKLLQKAKQGIADDMASREIGAIIWDNSTAGFHYLPDVVTGEKDNKPIVVRATGLYQYNGELYVIEETNRDASISHFYNHDTDVAPTVVTLTESVAEGDLGDPSQKKGFTSDGTLEEWLVIADCYFEALNE